MEAAKFGTGEGQLGIVEHEYVEYDYPYSGSAFESSFRSMGVPESRSRSLSNFIRRGGAVVTVNAGSRQAEAENILERHHGQLREESGSLAADEALATGADSSRIQVFGHVQRVYPSYISSGPGSISPDQPTRKAS